MTTTRRSASSIAIWVTCVLAGTGSLGGCGRDADPKGSTGSNDDAKATVGLLAFSGGSVESGEIEAASEKSVVLKLAKAVTVEPGDEALLALTVDNPIAKANPAAAMLVQLSGEPRHVRVPVAASAKGPGDLNVAFSVADDACSRRCATQHSLSLLVALELKGGGISKHLAASIAVDCSDAADAPECGPGDGVDAGNESPATGQANGSGNSGSDGGTQNPPTSRDGGVDGNPTSPVTNAPPLCPRGASTPVPVDKLDLLFVVDNSGSMREEQASLSAQFPTMIEKLTGGSTPFTKDLHIGVVSTDMGLVGINNIQGCSGLGDDGVMQNEPRLQTCEVGYPRFLTFSAGLNDGATVANDFACIASLGTEGCGFEQQLESGLKALWPGADNRIVFLGDVNGFGTQGHGDNENQGFLRGDPTSGLSVVAVVVVTDEEDCSSKNTQHFTPNQFLDPNNAANAALLSQGLNVRCFANPQNLYAIERYINGFKALRGGNEQLVVFAALAGVPTETVSADVLASTDLSDPVAREAFYDGILNHQLMQEVVEQNGTPDPADDSLRPSCNTANGKAYPPRRIVQVARGFGENGLVQSICEADFGPAMDAITGLISKRLADGGCVTR